MGKRQPTLHQVRTPTRVDFAGGWTDVHYFSEREGGAVLNAAIDRYVVGSARWADDGFRLEYSLDLPPGSHLGTSSAIDVAWLRLTHALIGDTPDDVALAEQSYRIEKALGIEGGKQDGYAAALGGVHLLRFGREDEPARVEQVPVPAATVAALEARCVLGYLGLEGAADAVHTAVWRRYRGGDAEIGAILREIRDTVPVARDALLRGDLVALAEQLTRNRDLARRLDERVVTPRMAELFVVGERAGAIGSKACGGGGGGGLLFIAAEGRKGAVAEALRAAGAQVIPFRFAPATPGD